MSKSAYDGSGLDFCWSGAGLSLFNDGREVLDFAVLSSDVLASGITCSTGSPKSVLIAVLWRNDTVCGHQDWSVKWLELFLLLPPSISVVSCEVLILLKEWIVVGRKHLGVGVNIYTGAFCLVKEHFQILKVMSGNQNSGIVTNTDIYGSDFRISVSGSICSVKKSHTLYAGLTGLQGKGYQIVYGKAVV